MNVGAHEHINLESVGFINGNCVQLCMCDKYHITTSCN